MKQSFDVTEERHSTQDPVFWRKGGFQVYSCDVVYVCPGGLLVDWTGIEAGVFYTIILSIHPDHWHHLKENFGFGVNKFAVAAVPASSLQVKTVDVHSLCGRLGDVILHPLRHLVAQHHAVQGPALVRPSDLLSHGCQEALRVEETCHPEAVGSPFKDPGLELTVPLKQLCEPEPQGAGGPR